MGKHAWSRKRLVKPKFAPSILINGGKQRKIYFPWGPYSLREPTTSNQINAENMKTQKNEFRKRIYLFQIRARALRLYYEGPREPSASSLVLATWTLNLIWVAARLQKTKKIPKRFCWFWTEPYGKTAYVPLSRIKPNVVQFRKSGTRDRTACANSSSMRASLRNQTCRK